MASSVVEALLKCSHAGDRMSSGEVDYLYRVCESGKIYLVRRAIDLLNANAEAIVLFQYSGDSTPVALKHYSSYESVGKKRRIAARVGSEFFVQQLFMTVRCPS
eukprot:2896598-Amphidinium_carterae.1